MPPGSTRLVVRLRARAGGTLVELEHHGLTAEERRSTRSGGRTSSGGSRFSREETIPVSIPGRLRRQNREVPANGRAVSRRLVTARLRGGAMCFIAGLTQADEEPHRNPLRPRASSPVGFGSAEAAAVFSRSLMELEAPVSARGSTMMRRREVRVLALEQLRGPRGSE